MPNINLEKLLDFIAGNVYDYGHGLLPGSMHVVDAWPLLGHLQTELSISTEEMGKLYDEARYRVHGEELREQDAREEANDGQ